MARDRRPAVVVSKYAPLPTRLSSKSLPRALDASLERLGMATIDLYLIHFPFLRIASMLDRMAEAVKAGKVRAVGVSNFSASQMEKAAELLGRRGIPLAANEVYYSLRHRHPERNGVLDACRRLDVALIAYRPLGGGRLRAGEEAQTPLGQALARVAQAHQKPVSQVALNWLLQRDAHVIAIPGATSAAHQRENAEALTWSLTDEEFAALDRAAG
jgi:diketogulonate reductase-like aldo/keto reductase